MRAAYLVLPAMVLVAACGESDSAAPDAEKAAVEGAADASVTDMGLDASTADAMSVDVAAGGIEPMIDPDTAATAPAAEAEAETPEAKETPPQ